MKGKMIRRILLGICLGVIVTSCTQHDGYIGPIFGKWQLTEMWEDGTMTPHDSLYYNFQTSIIMVQVVHRGGLNNWADLYYGSYVQEDDSLKFYLIEPSQHPVVIPPVLKLKQMGEENINTFFIEKLNSSKMILTRGGNERFVFRKF